MSNDEKIVAESNDDATVEVSENKMGVLPIKKLIVSMSLPMMISMLVQALYNIVDSIFVSRVGEEALTAVTYAFPLQMMIISVGSGIGVGVNAILSKSLGEKRQDRVNKAANNGVLLAIFHYLLFIPIGLFVAGPFISSQTQNQMIADMGTTYLRICCTVSFGVFLQMMFERLLQSTGKTSLSMISQCTGAIINMIMDPILIFGLLGAPKLGVAGAAYATVFGQVIASVLGLILNIKYNKEIQLSLKSVFSPDFKIIGKIYAIGIPSILMMSIGSIMNYFMNHIIGKFTDTAVAVFGAYFKLQSFIFMPVFGLNNGLIPVLAYNYGARKKDRIMEGLKFSMRLAVSIMLVGMIVFIALPNQLLGIFDATDKMIELGVPALRTIAFSFPIAGVCIALGSVFQAFAKSNYSLIVSIGRQLVVLLPVAWLLSQTGNLNMVWWAFPIAEGMSLLLSLIYFNRINNKIIKQL